MTMFPKPQIVRLKGKDLTALRIACFLRDRGCCTKCGRPVSFEGDHWDMPPMHMAHILNKRNHGDVISNVTTRCPKHHLVDMHNPKSVPSKSESRRA